MSRYVTLLSHRLEGAARTAERRNRPDTFRRFAEEG